MGGEAAKEESVCDQENQDNLFKSQFVMFLNIGLKISLCLHDVHSLLGEAVP